VYVLPSISGGAEAVQTLERTAPNEQGNDGEQAELLVGTRKGLFVLRGSRGRPMDLATRRFEGEVVEFAMRDDRTGRYFASVTNGFYGPRVYHTDDTSGEWQVADGVAFPEDQETSLDRVWCIRKGVEPNVLWAGVAPAALMKSE